MARDLQIFLTRLPKGLQMNMNAHPTKPHVPKRKNPEQLTIQIGLFDDNEHQDIYRVVPLVHFLNELHDLPMPQR